MFGGQRATGFPPGEVCGMTHPTDTHTYRHIEFRGLSGAMGISRHDAEARRIAVLGVCVALPVGPDRGLLFTPKHVEG